jgi:acyl-CoA synthetase (AMP-forming)/AMP-acid ligase II
MGAVGHHGMLLRRKFHNIYVPVEVHLETSEIRRSAATGFALRKSYEEGGEILVKLPSKSSWAGYWHANDATSKKLVENVFKPGDVYFRTGDALRRDSDGFWYFIDRLGMSVCPPLLAEFHLIGQKATHIVGKERMFPQRRCQLSWVATPIS